MKEEFIRRLELLEQKNAELENSVAEKEEWIERVTEALKSKLEGFDIVKKIQTGLSYRVVFGSESLGPPPSCESIEYSPAKERCESIPVPFSARSEARSVEAACDQQLQHHLIMLYFTWVHPVHTLFIEDHFVEDYKSGSSLYVTPSLTNAICALGCVYSSEEDTGCSKRELAKIFLKKSRQGLLEEDITKLPSIITYALFFLIELGLCQARSAASHLRLATELLSAMDTRHYDAGSVEICYFGIQSLNL